MILGSEAKTMKSNALKKPVINNEQVESLLAMRESLDALKKRYELLENAVKGSEQELISLLESGAEIHSDHELMVRATERRYPHWKEAYATLSIQVPGAPNTEEVLANTVPTISKVLVIK